MASDNPVIKPPANKGGPSMGATMGQGMIRLGYEMIGGGLAKQFDNPRLAAATAQMGEEHVQNLRVRFWRSEAEDFKALYGSQIQEALSTAQAKYQDKTKIRTIEHPIDSTRAAALQATMDDETLNKGEMPSADRAKAPLSKGFMLEDGGFIEAGSPEAYDYLAKANTEYFQSVNQLMMSYMDAAATYVNNPLIARQAEQVVNFMSQQAGYLVTGKKDAAEQQQHHAQMEASQLTAAQARQNLKKGEREETEAYAEAEGRLAAAGTPTEGLTRDEILRRGAVHRGASQVDRENAELEARQAATSASRASTRAANRALREDVGIARGTLQAAGESIEGMTNQQMLDAAATIKGQSAAARAYADNIATETAEVKLQKEKDSQRRSRAGNAGIVSEYTGLTVEEAKKAYPGAQLAEEAAQIEARLAMQEIKARIDTSTGVVSLKSLSSNPDTWEDEVTVHPLYDEYERRVYNERYRKEFDEVKAEYLQRLKNEAPKDKKDKITEGELDLEQVKNEASIRLSGTYDGQFQRDNAYAGVLASSMRKDKKKLEHVEDTLRTNGLDPDALYDGKPLDTEDKALLYWGLTDPDGHPVGADAVSQYKKMQGQTSAPKPEAADTADTADTIDFDEYKDSDVLLTKKQYKQKLKSMNEEYDKAEEEWREHTMFAPHGGASRKKWEAEQRRLHEIKERISQEIDTFKSLHRQRGRQRVLERLQTPRTPKQRKSQPPVLK